MTAPSRATPTGRAYLDLRNQARREGRPTQQLLTFYALERWLARLAASPYATRFILKGGMLLAAIDTRRPTVDADALARGIPSDHASIAAIVRQIASLPDPDSGLGGDQDGVTFVADSLTIRTIREEGAYTGVRVALTAQLATASVKVSLDINFGDPVTPTPPAGLATVCSPRHPAGGGPRLPPGNRPR